MSNKSIISNYLLTCIVEKIKYSRVLNDAEGFVGRFVRAAGNPLTTLESPSILITGDSVC